MRFIFALLYHLVRGGKFLVDNDKVYFELFLCGQIHDFYFAFTEGLQKGFLPHVEGHHFRANVGVSNLELGQDTYSTATVNLQSHRLLVDLHFTEDELIARLDCVDEVILISRNSTTAFSGVGRVIFTNRLDTVVLTL